jgi:hypothetical protein
VDEHYEFTEDDIIIEQPLEEEELEGEESGGQTAGLKAKAEEEEVVEVVQGSGDGGLTSGYFHHNVLHLCFVLGYPVSLHGTE